MKVNYIVGSTKHPAKPLHVHVVFPNGHIKDVQITTATESPMLMRELVKERNGRTSGIRAVHLVEGYKEAGYTLLAERWKEEGEDPEGYERYCKWHEEAIRRQVHAIFPVERLPKSVQAQMVADVDLEELLPKAPTTRKRVPQREATQRE